jgi:hypothetical protein
MDDKAIWNAVLTASRKHETSVMLDIPLMSESVTKQLLTSNKRIGYRYDPRGQFLGVHIEWDATTPAPSSAANTPTADADSANKSSPMDTTS